MSFYDVLAPYYDAFFPVDDAEMAFIARQCAGKTNVMDIGCGTGNKTVHLSAVTGHITAFDSDPGMIATAERDNARSNITYSVLDMSAIETSFAPESFDAAICLGNTLVHIPSLSGITALLTHTAACLRPGGLFLAQILNYDRILDQHVTQLPNLKSDAATFSRAYEHHGNLVRFITTLTVCNSGETHTNAIDLYPMRRAEYAECLTQAGLHDIHWFGGYDGSPLTPESFVCIALGIKK